MTDLIFYTRQGCHLCDQAMALVRDAGLDVRRQDISGVLELLRKYGTRIPVLRRTDTGDELAWPFGPDELETFTR